MADVDTTQNAETESVLDRVFGPKVTRDHILPFAVWIVLMLGLSLFGEPAPWKYAVRTAAGVAAMLWWRPWKWYSGPSARWLPAGVLVGVLVFLLWVLPEVWAGLQENVVQHYYLLFGVLPWGEIPDKASSSIYAPANCGWAFSLVRLAGSAFVIAVIEEFFWRGFLYRWLIDGNFNRVPLGRLHWAPLLIAAALFALEHNRWLVGFATGLIYILLMIRTRDIWAVVTAHVTTNLILGIFVLATGRYVFW